MSISTASGRSARACSITPSRSKATPTTSMSSRSSSNPFVPLARQVLVLADQDAKAARFHSRPHRQTASEGMLRRRSASPGPPSARFSAIPIRQLRSAPAAIRQCVPHRGQNAMTPAESGIQAPL
jgi:hypothetical protein